MMKRFLAITIVLVFILLLCACGGNSSDLNSSNNPKQQLESLVTTRLMAYCAVSYEGSFDRITYSSIDVDDDVYSYYGKFTVRDNYGDQYEGRVTAEYEYDGNDFNEISFDVERPTKVR